MEPQATTNQAPSASDNRFTTIRGDAYRVPPRTVGRNRMPLVQPGERGQLLSYLQYRTAREAGVALDNFDIYMRQPDDEESDDRPLDDKSRWQNVPALKYLKHRAIGWREAESIDELPEDRRQLAKEGVAFGGTYEIEPEQPAEASAAATDGEVSHGG